MYVRSPMNDLDNLFETKVLAGKILKDEIQKNKIHV